MNSFLFANLSPFRRILVLFFFAALLSACGKGGSKPKILQNVSLSTSDIAGEAYVNLGVSLDIGNVSLPSVTIPIFNPKNPGQIFGEVRTRGGFNGVNDIEVSVNMTQALQVQGGPASLPDGSPIPVGGLGSAAVIQLPIDNDRHRIYIAADKGVALLGAALTFKEFDSVGSAIRGADLMLPFTISGVRGAFGFFTSTQSRQSGFAVFVDLGSVITPSELALAGLEKGLAESSKAYALEAAGGSSYDRSSMYFIRKTTSKKYQKRFDKAMYKLHKKRKRLNLN